MSISKKSILALFKTDEDRALEPFYQLFGPSVRSEYKLDGLDIVDLDWEQSGCVISFVEGRLDQVRLLAYEESGYIFKGWMGDSIPTTKKNSSEILSHEGHSYKMTYEFLDAETLDSLIICKEI